MSENTILNRTDAPHFHTGDTPRLVMLDGVIALLPVVVMSALLFGKSAIVIIALSVLSCIVCETVFGFIFGRKTAVLDLSAAVTGIILACTLPINIPFWMVIVGAAVAILSKQIMGGIGKNIVNPAIFARLVLGIAFSETISTAKSPSPLSVSLARIFGTAPATPDSPVALLADGKSLEFYGIRLTDMFLGWVPGALGVTSVAAILIGCIYLVLRKSLNPLVPAVFAVSAVIIPTVFGHNPLYTLMAGSLMFVAVYCLSDSVKTPVTLKGKIVAAVGCGLIAGVLRLFGFDGVFIAVILMNIVTLFIDNLFIEKREKQ